MNLDWTMAPSEPTTVVVATRAGQFLLRDESGRQSTHSGHDLAAALGALPLYGGDLRLWLRWPTDEVERECLDANLGMLAEATGATVWVPPPGGTIVVRQDGADLTARDHAGVAHAWLPYRPPGAGDSPPDPPPGSPSGLAVAYVERSGRPHGVRWLPDRLAVNAETLTLHVPSAWPPERVAREGVPTADLFVLGSIRPASGRSVLRLRVQPGGAVAMSSVLTHAPPGIRQRVTSVGTYLLPAGWLDRARLEGGFRLAGSPLLLRSANADHGADGIPEDTVRWPAAEVTTEVFAVLPDTSRDGPADLLALYPQLPAVTAAGGSATAGSRAVRLRLHGGAGGGPAIDVTAGADLLDPLTSVRSRLAELRADGVELVLPRRAYGQVTATGLFEPEAGRWRSRTCPPGLTVTDLLAGTALGPLAT